MIDPKDVNEYDGAPIKERLHDFVDSASEEQLIQLISVLQEFQS